MVRGTCIWAPLLWNSGGVSGCVCSGLLPPLISTLLSMQFGLSFSRAHRQRGTQAGSRPASLRARVSKPFEFEARSTASNSLLSSLPVQPEAISLLPPRSPSPPLPTPPHLPRNPIPFRCPSSVASTRNRISSSTRGISSVSLTSLLSSPGRPTSGSPSLPLFLPHVFTVVS